MLAPSFPRVSRRCLAWLVWIGLLLPVAQVAAAAHALSHARQEASRDGEGKAAIQAAHCDLCLIAAAIGGGAPLSEPAAAPPVALRHEAPRAAFADVWLALPVPAYRSRAPPDASR